MAEAAAKRAAKVEARRAAEGEGDGEAAEQLEAEFGGGEAPTRGGAGVGTLSGGCSRRGRLGRTKRGLLEAAAPTRSWGLGRASGPWACRYGGLRTPAVLVTDVLPGSAAERLGCSRM